MPGVPAWSRKGQSAVWGWGFSGVLWALGWGCGYPREHSRLRLWHIPGVQWVSAFAEHSSTLSSHPPCGGALSPLCSHLGCFRGGSRAKAALPAQAEKGAAWGEGLN